MKEERYMWLFVFFDLPTSTKSERKAASQFRNRLIKDGFIMMQFSIYCRICKGDGYLLKHQERIKSQLPKKGHIRMLQITDKQYERMEILVGTQKTEEKIGTKQLLLF